VSGQIRRLRALVAINRAILGAEDYDEVLRLIVDETATFTRADACVLLLAGDAGPARVAASTGVDPEKARSFSAPLDEHVDEALRALYGFAPEDTFTGSPLVGGRGVHGILAVYHRARARRAPRRDEPFIVAALADQGAIAIEHARYRRERVAAERLILDRAVEIERAHHAERRMREDLQAVAASSAAVSEAILDISRTGLESVLHAAAAESLRLTGAQYAAVGLGADPGFPFCLFVVEGTPPGLEVKMGKLPAPTGTLGVVAQQGVVVRARDIKQHPAFRGFPPGHPDMTSFLGMPIAHRGQVVGNLFLANKRGAPEFTDEDVGVARMLASRIGVSIEIARLYDVEAAGRAWLRAVIDQMPDAIVLLDARGRVAAESRAAVDLQTADDGRRDPFGNPISLDLCHPSGERLPPEEMPHIRALVRGEPTVRVELALRRPDGTLLPVLADAVQVRGPHDEVIGATAIFQDISERKTLERLREEWMGVIAHDLRQPVSTIALAARLLQAARGSAITEQEARQLGRIVHCVDRLGTMIAELLDVTLLDARRLRTTPRALDVAGLAREVVERTAGATAGHPVSVHEAGPIPPAWADPDRVEQVLANLLSNAAKYGEPATEIRVDVTGRGHEIEVAVTNRGRGLPPEEVARLFQRFMRSRASRGSDAPGIGLGLYICKGLVEAQGGRIWADSVQGEATTFHFTLPARVPEEEPRAA
jgi:signal transduction histidine kinase